MSSRAFAAWAGFVVRRPVWVLLTVLIVTVALGAQIRKLRLDIRERDQLPQDHAYVQLYNRINDHFGGGAIVLIAVIARQGTIFTPDSLASVDRIARAVEGLPGINKGNVLSLASSRIKALEGTADGVDVHTLMPDVPSTTAAADALRADVFRNDLYVGTLVSADATATAIILEVPVDTYYPTLHGALEAIVAPERGGGVDVVLAGAPIVMSYLDRYTAQMALLFPFAVVVIALVHYEAFRTAQAMVLPLVTALLSVAWALGIMGSLRAPVDTWSAIAPVAILAIAAGHAVQVLKRYYEEYAVLGDNQRAIVASIVRVGPVMVTAGVIAAAGFASLATFQISSVRVFGLLMACGILSALIIEMTFIPACRALLKGPAQREAVRERESRWLTPLLQMLARVVVARPWAVLAVAAVIVAFCAIGATRLHVDSSLRGYFAESSQMRQDDALINQKFAGTSIVKLLLEGHTNGALEQPEVLRAIADLQAFLAASPDIGKSMTVADYVQRMHKAMSPEDAAASPIPDRQPLIAQYLFLYSMSGQPDDLSNLVDLDYRDGIVLAFSKTDGAAFVHGLVRDLNAFVAERFKGLPVTVGIAGGAMGAQAALNEVVVQEKIRNIIQVTVIIFVLSAVAFRSLVGALLVLVPLAVAVVVNFGVMGWTHTWLSMSTAAVTAMGVSIGADFAIYLIFRLREELATHGLGEAVRQSLLTSGKAIFFVSSAVTLGYLTLVFSNFSAWMHLGGLTALIMTVSSLAAVSVLPALVMIVRPHFLWRGQRSPELALGESHRYADRIASQGLKEPKWGRES